MKVFQVFFHCYNLNSIIIPKNVTRIEMNAFSECHGLSEMIFEDLTGWKIEETGAAPC